MRPSLRSVGAILLCLLCLTACEKQQALVDKLSSGEFFPNILLQPLDASKAVPVEHYRGKVVVLNVWATWCEPCRREMPNLQALSDALDPQRFVVLGMAQDDDDHLVREYLLDKGVDFTNYIDPNGQIATDELGIQIFPYTLIIARDGRFVQRISGPREWHHPDVIKLLEQVYLGDFSGLLDG